MSDGLRVIKCIYDKFKSQPKNLWKNAFFFYFGKRIQPLIQLEVAVAFQFIL